VRFTPSQYYYQQSKGPVIVVNGPYFSYQTGQCLSLIIQNGKMIDLPVAKLKGQEMDSGLYYYPTRAALGIDRKRRANIAWIFTDPQRSRPYAFNNGPVIAKGKEEVPSIYDLGDINWIWWEMRTAIGGGPMLIQDGKIRITSREEQMYFASENEKAPRTAMGYTADNRLIILVIQGRSPGQSDGATLLQTATLMKNLGCLKALNFDGGGSTCMLINGKETIHPSDDGGQRPMPFVFVVKAAE
jgi:exopolysaccharide biosynthesis protein